MERTITLTDGEHVIKTPTYYALQLLDENGGNSGSIVSRLPRILAALLTDSEPLDKGEPKKVWTVAEVSKLIPTKAPADPLWDAIRELMDDALPDAPASAPDRPTTRPGGKKQSGRPASSGE